MIVPGEEAKIASDEFSGVNGVVLSPDQTLVYAADYGGTLPGPVHPAIKRKLFSIGDPTDYEEADRLKSLTWVLRPVLVKLPGLSALDDSGIAMAGAILLFLIPSGEKSDPLLLRWTYAEQLPWSVSSESR